MSTEDIMTLEQSYRRWYKNHKVSADKQWIAYRAHILEYPDKVTYQDSSWILYDMYCGKRSDPDQFYFIREVSKQEALFDENFDRRQHSWYWPDYVLDEATGIYYKIKTLATFRFTSKSGEPHDPSFACWIDKFNYLDTTRTRKGTMSRTSSWCDDPLSYEINEHSMSVDVSKAGRSIRLELSECTELASFLATAKEKIKEAKIASLKEQQDALQKALRDVETM